MNILFFFFFKYNSQINATVIMQKPKLHPLCIPQDFSDNIITLCTILVQFILKAAESATPYKSEFKVDPFSRSIDEHQFLNKTTTLELATEPQHDLMPCC